jgi:polyisoprenoid-binding protein YceI
MRLIHALPALALPFAALAAPALAADAWTLDKSHAHVTFSADHLGFSMVQGQFREFDAEIAFDPDAIENSSVTFTIQADSVDTNWADRDAHIRGADFLNVEQHPTITFVSTSVERVSDTEARVTGDLTMVGETREATFDVTLNKMGDHPFDPSLRLAGFSATGEIVRADFGVTYGGDAFAARVPVQIDLEMTQPK